MRSSGSASTHRPCRRKSSLRPTPRNAIPSRISGQNCVKKPPKSHGIVSRRCKNSTDSKTSAP